MAPILAGLSGHGTEEDSIGDSQCFLDSFKARNSLTLSASKFSGTGNLVLWKKRILGYLTQRDMEDESRCLDGIKDSCTLGALDFLAMQDGIMDEEE